MTLRSVSFAIRPTSIKRIEMEPNCAHMQAAQIRQFGGGHRFRGSPQGVPTVELAAQTPALHGCRRVQNRFPFVSPYCKTLEERFP